MIPSFDAFLKKYLPHYYKERMYNELSPEEAGRKAAEEVMERVRINAKRLDEVTR